MVNKKYLLFTILLTSLIIFVNASTFQDLIQGDFNNGTFYQTFYNTSGFVQLNATNTTGNFTSQIFNAGGSSTWNNISWTSSAIGELPSNQEVETSFGSGNANMTGNVLLMHFNNASNYGENDTHVYDFSGNGNNGSVTSATWTSSGKLNGAMEFDGSDDYVDCGNDGSLTFGSGDSFTYSAWIYQISAQSGWRGIVYHGATGESQGHIGLQATTRYLSGGTGDGSTWQTHSSTYAPSLNTWVHVAITLDRNLNVLKLYAEGIEVGNFSHSYVPTATSVGLRIGEGNPNSERFNGTMDEVAIWNRTLTATEIQDIYKRGATRLNLTVQNCSSDDCSGGTWQDINDTSPQDLNLTSQYFQYKYEFETDNASYSPELYNVSLDYDNPTSPVVNISLVYPTQNISVYKNRFFNFTVNVSCSEADCGEVNVSLDPVVNWWNSSFEKRKEINITNVGSSTLENFPAYLNISKETDMQADFDDLRFINGSCEEDSNLELAYEIENYTSSNAHVWLKIPSLATGVNKICMYYNNSGASSGENATGVWDDDYRGIYHLSETGTSAQRNDSTQYENNMNTITGFDGDEDVDGIVGGATDFDGSDDILLGPPSNNLTGDYLQTATFSAWVKHSTSPTNYITSLKRSAAHSTLFSLDGANSGDLGFLTATYSQSPVHSWLTGGSGLNDNNWHQLVATIGGLNRSLYIDGQFIKSDNLGIQNVSSNTAEFAIGGFNVASLLFDGSVDEVRFARTNRSADWINQSYQMIANPTTYVSSGAEEEYSAPGKGLISTTPGTTPFYTNKSSNPFNISLNQGESQLVTFWVNATGEYDASYDFFAYANVTSNLSIGAITETLNLTIISNPILISNSVQSPESPTNYVGTYQFNITVSDYDGDYDTVYFSWNSGANQTITTYENVSGGREYYHSQETAITGNDIPFSWFVNDSEGNTNTSSGTYTISAAQTSASLSLDKIISLQELNSTDITYNITLRTTNKGGSDATSVILNDTDSSSSPYDLGTIGEGEISSTSYLKSYQRNSTNYNVSLAVAFVNGTDSYQGNETNDTSSEIVLIVPATTADTLLTVLKNAEYLSENSTHVDYNLSVTVVNSGGIDLTSINIQDSDISLDTSINLNRTKTYLTSGTKSVAKTGSNAEHTFAKANATYNAVTYDSNELKVLIPGSGDAGALYLVKSASLLETTNTNVTYNITLSLTNNGGRNLTSVEINDTDSESSPYNIGTLTSGQEVLRSYTKTYDRTTYASNQTLVSASANGTDAISGLIETTAGEIVIIIPGTQTPASFILDKIATIHNVTNTTINYNITLRVVNKGGSDATNSNITDSDSENSPYDLGTVSNNESVERSYIENFTRQDTITYQLLSVATAQAIDSYLGSLISANSTEINVTIPDTEIGKQITITKNVVYSSENSTAVIYNVSSTLYNSGDEDLTSINYIDTDLNDTAFTIDINKGDSHLISKLVTLDKAASNENHQFALGTATISGLNFYSNRPTIRIPGYGGPADAIVIAPVSVQTSTSFDTTITVENQNPDIGQDFTIEYWITNVAEDTNYTSGEQTIYVASSGSSDLTATLTSPSSAGDYRYRAIVTWAGGTATAYDSFTVTAPSSDDGDTGGSSGGGSITGRATEEIVCNAPYIRYEKGCCLDSNNNSICDKDEILKSPEEENKTKEEGITGEETPKKESQFLKNIKETMVKIGNFFSSIWQTTSSNKNYIFISLGILALAGIVLFLLVFFIIKRKPRDITRLKSIKGIKVYGADGHKIGVVKEAYLGENKIYGWLIKVDRSISKKIKKKNILVKQKHVESIKHIMIIDKRVSEHLEKLDSETT